MDENGETSPDMAIGRVIETVRKTNSEVVLHFADHSTLTMKDTAQNCCEARWITCDDDLQSFTGDKFLGWETAYAPSDRGPIESADSDDRHDIMFLRIKTSGGIIVCETHNRHNGYYGGFNVEAKFDAMLC